MNKKILIPDALAPVCDEVFNAAGFTVDRLTGATHEQIVERIGSYDGMVVRSGVRVTAEMIERAESMRAIGRAGAGVDNIDVEAATRAGIFVLNTPGGNTISAAEHTIALLLALLRKIPAADRSMKEGAWDRKAFKGRELFGKRVAVIGLGRIGREVARRLSAFSTELLGHDPFLTDEAIRDLGLRPTSLDEALFGADIVSLHVPLNEHTRPTIDADKIAGMRDGSIILNVARGGIVDEQALLSALASGKVAGAAIDVWEKEPPVDRALAEHPAVVATPHIAASTSEAQERVAEQIARSMIALFSGDEVPGIVNPTVDART